MARRIYIAAPLAYAYRANSLVGVLRKNGHEVVSHWHWIGGSSDPEIHAVRSEILKRNLEGLDAACCVVVLADSGLPRATFCEVGWALARSKSVVWVQGPKGEGKNIFDAHPLVRIVQTDGIVFDNVIDALNALPAARQDMVEGREVVSAPDASVQVTELHLSANARASLGLPPKQEPGK